MATLTMSELATTDVAQSDAFKRKQALPKPASTRNTSSESDRVGAGVRVLRVLVVAAEQGSANALLRQVRYAGHGAHAAPDGLAALRVATVWHPDVVLLDLETPLMNGCLIATHLRSHYSSEDCLIIAFAEWVDDACRKPCVEAGIDLLLSKPVDQDVVQTLLMLECVRVNRRRAREAVNTLNPFHVDRTSTKLHSE
jgi:CheY-like chemotaxis protein